MKSQLWTTEIIGSDGCRKKVKQFRFPIHADHLNQIGVWIPQTNKPLSLLLNLAKQKKEYENMIKEVYLEIANGLLLLDSTTK